MTDSNPRAVIGDNEPPLAERLAMTYADKVRAADLYTRIELGEIELGDDKGLAFAADVVRSCRAMAQELDALRAGEKRPFDEAAKTVQAFFAKPILQLTNCKTTAEGIITRHNRRKEEAARALAAEAARKMREEADRQLAVAARMEDGGHGHVGEAVIEQAQESERMAQSLDRAATGRAADLVRDSAAGTSARGSWVFEITDQERLRQGLGTLGDHFTVTAIEAAIRSYVAAEKKAGRGPKLPGVEFTWENKAFVR